MRRTVWIVAVAALCVAGSAVAQDRSGQYLGNGGRAEDGGQMMGSGNATGQTLGSGGFLGSGTRSEDGSPIFGSGGYLGSGNRTTDDAGGVIGSGTRSEDSGQVIGSGSSVTAQDGGYLIGGGRGGYYGSGHSVLQLRLLDGSSLLVVSSDEGTFVILLEE